MSIDKIKLRQLFSNMCCSNCKTDFDENAINTMAEFLCNMSDFIDVYEPLSRVKQSIDLICQKDIQ